VVRRNAVLYKQLLGVEKEIDTPEYIGSAGS
jgi:hypothetical protein